MLRAFLRPKQVAGVTGYCNNWHCTNSWH